MSDTPRTKAATRMAFTSEYMVEIEEAQKLERELEEARKQRDKWKANHDNQVAINRTLRDRPDLGERAKLVDALTKQRDALAEALTEIRAWGHHSTKERLRCFINKALAATKGGSHE
jgi:hypothetical protein